VNCVGNFKLSQFRKLCRILQSSLVQILRILRTQEGIRFEFTSLSSFLKIWIIIKPRGPRLLAIVYEQCLHIVVATVIFCPRSPPPCPLSPLPHTPINARVAESLLPFCLFRLHTTLPLPAPFSATASVR
jgi:hypothetical protein